MGGFVNFGVVTGGNFGGAAGSLKMQHSHSRIDQTRASDSL
nr:hypothetical protein [Bradyrhizobium diazoefficiens]